MPEPSLWSGNWSRDDLRMMVASRVHARPASVWHQVTFNGKHNKIKTLSWLALMNWQDDRGADIYSLALYVGTRPHSLRTLLARWIRWQYVERSYSLGGALFQLTQRGKEWLFKHFKASPFQDWYKQMANFQREFYSHNLRQWSFWQ